MASRTCTNILCGSTTSSEWKRGWILGSGSSASLCSSCGSAYEQQVFCETFHAVETGWRGCASCGKLLHCGCIASLPLIELLDTGGVKCMSCTKNSIDSSSSEQKLNGSGTVSLNNFQIKHVNSFKDIVGSKKQIATRNAETDMVVGQLKRESISCPPIEIGNKTSQVTPSAMVAEDFGAFISLGGTTGNSHPFLSVAVEERGQGNTSPALQLGTPSRHLLPKPSKSPLSASISSPSSMAPQMRIPRPPVDGRGRNQMLPRYWPRITEQELQQIAGDPNCTVLPLFEKVLSASDAGRIGRLVLPKACAEAYFPPISQPEGLPIKIKDIKGKEWVFQFRFWPNNNSRMYVLEGVTPCIQSMQLQAGDTVTFSRMDPEGKLVMGFRKASAALPSIKGSIDPHANGIPKQINTAAGQIIWNNAEKHRASENILLSSMIPEKKRCRNIGPKSKRLHIDSQDVLELKLTWEEVQDMLRAPENANPTVVMIEDHEIEEYEEPPVLGKWSIFAVRSSGIIEQWTQCDNCSKWRGLPAEVLLPSKWTCGENAWDKSRCSCSAPDDLTPKEIEKFLQLSKDWKKRKVSVYNRNAQQQDPCGLEALANAATIHGDNPADSAPGASSSAGAITTKHPRHKPGCSCIVCIQPPSGKGKHKPMCDCNVCSTVKRRFQTLMMRKKRRQSEQEAEIANGRDNHNKFKHNMPLKDDPEVGSTSTYHSRSCFDHPAVESEGAPSSASDPQAANSQSPNDAGKLDLNCDPQNKGEVETGLPHASMTGLLQLASLPLESYMTQNGLTTLTSDQQVSSGLSGPLQITGEAEASQLEDQITDSTVKERDNVGEESCSPDENVHNT